MTQPGPMAFTAPHRLATRAGQQVLQEGGTAIEAMVAAAAAISVVYPHMNAIGGDGFWLIHQPGQEPVAIDACGQAGQRASIDWYAEQGLNQIPERGGAAALTGAATIKGWQLALSLYPTHLPLARLLEPAIAYARHGFEVSESLVAAMEKLSVVDNSNTSFRSLYYQQGQPYPAGSLFTNPDLAQTFEQLARAGLDDFYTGDLGQHIAQALVQAGSPLTFDDLQQTQAEQVQPVSLTLSDSQVYNLPPSTQGPASLMILALVDRLRTTELLQADTELQWTHAIVEATKRAFQWRNACITDRTRLPAAYDRMLTSDTLQNEAGAITTQATTWPAQAQLGDTVWMGACDQYGTMVSFIQSVFFEFGCGVAIPDGGFVWNNRGSSFSLDKNDLNSLQPGAKPFHTLNPAYAMFNDGRRLAYGTMGGEGQPQTQAAVFSRYAWRNQPLTDAVAAPRWLLGRTWGEATNNLKLEADLAAEIGDDLAHQGHDLETVPAQSELMGHAGAVLLTPDAATAATATAAVDPRSDGAAWTQNNQETP